MDNPFDHYPKITGTPKDGGQAFPWSQNGTGMTLRDYFAAQALNGMMSCASTAKFDGKDMGMADGAYYIADAMLKAREADDENE